MEMFGCSNGILKFPSTFMIGPVMASPHQSVSNGLITKIQ